MTSPIFLKAIPRTAAIALMVLAPIVIPAPALAQNAATSTLISLTFTGTVTTDPATTIQLRQPDGSFVPYTGPLATDFPYKAGDTVTVSMTATVPTQAYFDGQTAAGTPVPADGIYHIKLSSDLNGSGSNPNKVGNVTPATISGGLVSTGVLGEPNYTTLSITYDTSTKSYALDKGGSFYDSAVLGAGFSYDPASGSVSTCRGLTCAPEIDGYGGFNLSGSADGTSITTLFSSVWDKLGNAVGSFKFGLTGSWNLPNSGTGATDVPEPGMLALFGAAALVPVLRRRRATRTKVPREG